MARPSQFADNCDFCSIARGEERAVRIVCEAEDWVAFFPLNPATKGHTLVIPRRHVADVWELDVPLGAQLMAAVVRVGKAVLEAVRPEGMNLISSKGAAAEQSVFHLHLHILPRWEKDDLGRIWPKKTAYEAIDLDALAERIRTGCSEPLG